MWASTFLAPEPSARVAVQLVHASDHMILEDRIKIVLAPGQTTIESVLLLAQLERLGAKDKRGSEMRSGEVSTMSCVHQLEELCCRQKGRAQASAPPNE